MALGPSRSTSHADGTISPREPIPSGAGVFSGASNLGAARDSRGTTGRTTCESRRWSDIVIRWGVGHIMGHRWFETATRMR